MQYRREIDGLRAVAVIPVILFHAGFTIFSGGYVGVDIFFVISGYLITSILINELEEGKFSILRFYERRARRILPALFFVVLYCIPFAWTWMLPAQFEGFSKSLIAVSLFASNILFWKESGYFDTAAEEKPLLHTWSLAVEEQYYIIFPIFLMLLWRFGRSPIFYSIVALSIISFALSELGWRNKPSANFYLAPTRAWELLAGSICAFIQHGKAQRSNNAISTIGLIMVVFAMLFYDDRTPFPSVYALVPVVGTTLIIMYGSHGTWVAKLLSLKGFVGIGLISYSAYLWHQPLFAFARIRSENEPTQSLMIGLTIASLLIAGFSWRYIELPFRNRPLPLLRTQRAVFGIASFTGVSIICIGSYFLTGPRSETFEINARITHINALGSERMIAIKAGSCHFNGVGEYTKIDTFVENWNCLNNDNSTTAPLAVAIYGDSHAADRAASFRQAGFDVLQVGGAGCPLTPETDAEPHCSELIELFHSAVNKQKINTIVLSNRTQKYELNVEYLSKVIKYWSERYERVLIFTPMPEFPKLREIYIRNGASAVEEISLIKSDEEAFFEIIGQIQIPGNVRFLNTREIFCMNRIPCTPIVDQTLLLIDSDHLSVEGDDYFGGQLRLLNLFSDNNN